MRKILCLLLALIMLFGLCGCDIADTISGWFGKTVAVDALNVPKYEDNNSLFLAAEMPPDFSIYSNIIQYMEAGFNILILGEDYFEFGSEKFKQVLADCNELGLDVMIRIRRYEVEPQQTKENYPTRFPTYFETGYRAAVDFHDYPAIIGFFVIDEPTWFQLLEVKASYLPWFNENYGGDYMFFCNFFSSQSVLIGKDFDGVTVSYDRYASFYNEEVLTKANSTIKSFSMDTYPIKKSNGRDYIGEQWLRVNMNTANYAKKNGVNFGCCMQAFEGYAETRLPASAADMRLLMYVYLAYGARTFEYFGYRETFEAGVNYPMMTTGGVKNDLYYYVQEVNNEVSKFDHVLMAFDDWHGVMTNIGTGNKTANDVVFDNIIPQPSLVEIAAETQLKSLSGVKKFKSKFNCIVGEFSDKDDNLGFVLTNFDDHMLTRTNKVEMEFEEADGVLIYRKGEPEVIGLANHKFEITLESREGVLIIPLYKK